ncbi:DUF1450 domain-containing protein [Paenibacillus validus]|uniref:DUF1450 domain-containing protein n=1 Tax=Paenibacillus TaxID=44249 RepID=UPI0006D1EE09|nr:MULTISPECIES: DUF1450 domain-containing protein [Paenibacillus]MED4602207.1 DUF1450 domain-containing protein [Paenibacillus validus]MED4607373.1 DUF1450 domain-containing protein [Paenibacillus validus]
MKIKYCCKNIKNGSKSVYKTMKDEFPEFEHKKKDCLGCCKLCSKQCVAKVGKSGIICAESPDQLYLQLKQLLHGSVEEPLSV